jgi:hypothetical protein
VNGYVFSKPSYNADFVKSAILGLAVSETGSELCCDLFSPATRDARDARQLLDA